MPVTRFRRAACKTLLPLALVTACTPLPDTGRDPARLGPTPALVPLDALVQATPPVATAELATALMQRGDALKRVAAGM
ncbi:MAG: hypothetical protein RIR62_665 [Pseudomonadota bacterium]